MNTASKHQGGIVGTLFRLGPLALVTLCINAYGSPTPQEDTGSSEGEPSAGSSITREEAELTDVRLLAEARGWSVSDTQMFAAKQETFRQAASLVRDRFPDDFSSAINLEGPASRPLVYFKGTAPLDAVSLLAAHCGNDFVEIVEDVGLNEAEWEKLQDSIVQAMVGSGYEDFGVGFDSERSIEVHYPSTADRPLLPSDSLWQPGRDLPALAEGRVVLVPVDGPLSTQESNGGVHGGGEGRDFFGDLECTIGWCVETSGGTRGVVTAGHCSNAMTYRNPFDDVQYSMTTVLQHEGSDGDFQWHTTTGPEWPNWWADENFSLRTMGGLKNTWFRNDSTCVYGRATNQRICTQIYRTNVTSGVHGTQVLVDSHVTTTGDSGAGWSEGFQAHGVHSGWSNWNGIDRSRYSRASRVNNALGVDICVSP